MSQSPTFSPDPEAGPDRHTPPPLPVPLPGIMSDLKGAPQLKGPRVIVNTAAVLANAYGPASVGASVEHENGYRRALGQFIGTAYSSLADWRSVLLGVEEARKLGAVDVEIRTASVAIHRQLHGDEDVRRPELKALAKATRDLLSGFQSWNSQLVQEGEACQGMALDAARAALKNREGKNLSEVGVTAAERGRLKGWADLGGSPSLVSQADVIREAAMSRIGESARGRLALVNSARWWVQHVQPLLDRPGLEEGLMRALTAEPSLRAVVHAGGVSRGKKGPAGAGAVVSLPDGRQSELAQFVGEATQLVASWRAVVLGLKIAKRESATEVEIRTDAKTVISQLKGEVTPRDRIARALAKSAQGLLGSFESWGAKHVPRAEVQGAAQAAEGAIENRDKDLLKLGEEALERAAKAGLPALHGSLRQVAWAAQIRERVLNAVSRSLAESLVCEMRAVWWIENRETFRSAMRQE